MERKLESQAEYMREIAKIIAKLPVERAAEVYDFARFLLSPRPIEISVSDEDDWLNDNPEEIAKEDAVWDAFFARNAEQFRAMADDAIAEFEAGKTTPLFDDKGELNLP